jgi:hypothetical protein
MNAFALDDVVYLGAVTTETLGGHGLDRDSDFDLTKTM